jgi:hypothetical protein
MVDNIVLKNRSQRLTFVFFLPIPIVDPELLMDTALQ